MRLTYWLTVHFGFHKDRLDSFRLELWIVDQATSLMRDGQACPSEIRVSGQRVKVRSPMSGVSAALFVADLDLRALSILMLNSTLKSLVSKTYIDMNSRVYSTHVGVITAMLARPKE